MKSLDFRAKRLILQAIANPNVSFSFQQMFESEDELNDAVIKRLFCSEEAKDYVTFTGKSISIFDKDDNLMAMFDTDNLTVYFSVDMATLWIIHYCENPEDI